MTRITLSVGRQRASNAITPLEKGYRAGIQNQTRKLQDNLRAVIREINNVTPEALVFGLQPAFDESQRLVPVDKGPLKASGFLRAKRTPTGASVGMGYGFGGKPVYAAFVHERVDIQHKAPTQAKFLQVAVDKKFSEFQPRVVAFMQRNTGLTP